MVSINLHSPHIFFSLTFFYNWLLSVGWFYTLYFYIVYPWFHICISFILYRFVLSFLFFSFILLFVLSAILSIQDDNHLDHIVLLRCRDGAFAKHDLNRALRSLSSIDGVIDMTAGETYTTNRSNGYTHGLVARIRNRDALTTYATHPKHLDVKGLIIKSLQPLLTKKVNEGTAAAMILPPVLAVDYHSDRYPGEKYNERNASTSVSHVVLLCLRPDCDPNCASCRNLDEALKKGAENMASGIPGVCDITFGRTFTKVRSCGYTHCLNVRFCDVKSGEKYQPHALHSVFKKYLKGHLKSTKVNNMPSVLGIDWVGSRQ